MAAAYSRGINCYRVPSSISITTQHSPILLTNRLNSVIYDTRTSASEVAAPIDMIDISGGNLVSQTQKQIDPEQLAAKYKQEREKRLRDEGTAQYKELSYDGPLAKFLDDPFSPVVTPRDPVSATVDVVVVGTGLSGIIAAAELAKAGVSDIIQIDSAGGFGGTWYWNRYPGVRCDTESYIYMPLLEDTGTIPIERFATGGEILEQFDRVARMYELDKKALFQTRITSVRWNEEESRWIVATDRSDNIKARFIILATGRLHRLKLPGVPGIEKFEGHTFHTGRWDYAYTGGDSNGGLVNLRDKRVAIVGTGATAVQCIPHLADSAQELFVIQRTPTAVANRAFKKTEPDFAEGLEPGWQQRRQLQFERKLSVESLVKNVQHDAAMDDDGWADVWGFPKIEGDLTPQEIGEGLTVHDFELMEAIRQRVNSIVEDPATAEALKPFYYRFCKRPTFSTRYLEAFNQPNVHLLDTDGKGLDELTEKGIVVNGELIEVDCIVFATGQEAGVAPPRAGEFSVIGRDGVRLEDQWDSNDNISSVHGILAHGFPNMLLSGGMYQSAAAVNLTYPLTEQAKHVAAITSAWLRSGARSVEVTQEAVDRYAAILAEKEIPDNPGCTPGYYNSEGRGKGLFSLIYGGTVEEYNELLEQWRNDQWETETKVSFGN